MDERRLKRSPPEDRRFEANPSHRARPLLDLFPPAAPPVRAARAEPSPIEHGPRVDPRFLYHSASRDRLLREIVSAVARGAALLVVTAGDGIGKTLLCRTIADRLGRQTPLSLVARPGLDFAALLIQVLVDFGAVPGEPAQRASLLSAGTGELLSRVHDFLASLAPAHAAAVLVVDDAHEMPVETIGRLRELIGADRGQPLLQVVLVGAPSLSGLIGRSALRELDDSAVWRGRLEPLGNDEIANYIAHRMAITIPTPTATFDASAVARISALSGGAPRTIDRLVDNAVVLAGEQGMTVIAARTIAQAASADAPSSYARGRRLGVRVVIVLVLCGLAAAGAAAAAWIFSARVNRAILKWENVPPAPPPPARKSMSGAPIEPPAGGPP